MSVDHYFYVESRASGAWTFPDDLFPNAPVPHPLHFAWLKGYAPQAGLFRGDPPYFPVRNGPPPDRGSSLFFRWLAAFGDNAEDEFRLCWIPFAELLVDLWDETELLLVGRAANQVADLFGAGRGRFPYAEIAAAGLSDFDVRPGHRTDTALNPTVGQERYRRSRLPPDALVAVTWAETITEHLWPGMTEKFRSLRRYGRDEELRIIMTLS